MMQPLSVSAAVPALWQTWPPGMRACQRALALGALLALQEEEGGEEEEEEEALLASAPLKLLPWRPWRLQRLP